MQTTLILVGGFLGAGKTTLLAEAARRAAAMGKTVGLITNDQVPELVDTAILSHAGSNVREVSGSCFCCNFPGFQAAIASLASQGAELIIAEPVGSCTDISSTILQPLKDLFPHYRLAPFSVLVDPDRLTEVLISGGTAIHPDAAYILRLQLAEADRIILSKADTLDPARRQQLTAWLETNFPGIPVSCLSAVSGEGVDAWLDDELNGQEITGQAVLEIDYDRYATGEAVLGWLNSVVQLQAAGTPAWTDFAQRLLVNLQTHLARTRSEIGHVKLILETGDGQVLANLTGLGQAVAVRKEGNLSRLNAKLTMNARVQTSPDALEAQFRNALVQTATSTRTEIQVTALHCIQPGRPNPTYRYAEVITPAGAEGLGG